MPSRQGVNWYKTARATPKISEQKLKYYLFWLRKKQVTVFMHFWLAFSYFCCLFSVRYRCIGAGVDNAVFRDTPKLNTSNGANLRRSETSRYPPFASASSAVYAVRAVRCFVTPWRPLCKYLPESTLNSHIVSYRNVVDINTKSVQTKTNSHQTHRHYFVVGGASKT